MSPDPDPRSPTPNVVSYTYDLNGNLKTRTPGTNPASSFTCDALNRVTDITHVAGLPGVASQFFNNLFVRESASSPKAAITPEGQKLVQLRCLELEGPARQPKGKGKWGSVCKN